MQAVAVSANIKVYCGQDRREYLTKKIIIFAQNTFLLSSCIFGKIFPPCETAPAPPTRSSRSPWLARGDVAAPGSAQQLSLLRSQLCIYLTISCQG